MSANRKPPNYDYTARERNDRLRARGRRVDIVITNVNAIAALDTLINQHGSVRSAIEHALKRSK